MQPIDYLVNYIAYFILLIIVKQDKFIGCWSNEEKTRLYLMTFLNVPGCPNH